MKRLSVLLIVFTMVSTVTADSYIEFLVNGVPYSGEDVEPSDIVQIALIDDRGPAFLVGALGTSYINVSNADNCSLIIYGPPPIGIWECFPFGCGCECTFSGTWFGTMLPPSGVVFTYEFHVPDDLQLSDEIIVDYDIAYQYLTEQTGQLVLHVYADPTLTLISPNGGESLLAGSTHTVSWEDNRDGGSCSNGYVIKYSTDGGQNWSVDFSLVVGSCEHEWTVPSVVSDQVMLRVCDSVDSSYCDISDGPFSISRCGSGLPGDFNDDCYVNGDDYALFASWFDFGFADMTTLALLANNWLSCGDSSDPDCLD